MGFRYEDDDYFLCPHCGAEVPVYADVCSECGASDDAGWDGDDPVDEYVEEDDFDYDDFIRREFPGSAATRRPPLTVGRAFHFTVVAALILAMLWLMFGWTCRA